MERRVSPRTQTSIPIAVCRGKTRYLARCVELSQSGLLAIMPKGIRDSAFEYVSANLLLDGGVVSVLLRRIRLKNELVAYRIVDIDDKSQNLLTEYLFDQLYSTLPPRTKKTRVAA
ncbi:MAG: PilZ domain-containing protein [Polyangiaceae bacterium]|nr:PilZ domain-containing protein [Polyangiaceae bacterium]